MRLNRQLISRLGVVVLAALVLGACAKTQEVIQPISSLQKTLDVTVSTTPGVTEPVVSSTPNAWPTTGVGNVSPTQLAPTMKAEAAELTKQPETGPSVSLLLGAVGLGLTGLTVMAWGWTRLKRR